MVETNRGINPISFFPGQDYQTAPPIRSRGGVHPKEVVVVEQLEQVRQELEQSIQVDLTPVEQQLEQERTRALGAEQDLGNRISRVALANIRQIVPCAAITTSLPKDFSSIPGFTPGVPAPEQGRLFVNSTDGTQGYYLAQNGALVRDPNFADVEAFTAGQLVVVRTGGTRYFLATDATAGTASEINADFQFYGDDKGTVSTDIQNGNAARVIDAGNKYEVSLAADPADISQAGNIARLSEARRTQLDNTQEVANQAAADIVQIRQLEQQLVSDNVAQGNALAANSEAIAREHTTNQTQDSLLQEIRTDVNSALTTNQTQDDLLQALRTDLNTEHTSNLNQDTLIQGLRADVNSALTTNQTQDDLLQALRTDLNTEHTSNLNQDTLIQGLRADVNSTLTTNQTQDSLLQALRTDLNTEHTSNLNQDSLIQGLRTDTDANTAQVALRLTDAQVRALWLQLEQEANPYYWLVSGNASLFTDDVGRNYTRTDFSVSLPAGDWDWIKKQVDTSGTPRKILNTTEDTFVGNTYNISFYTDVDSNNALKPVGDREVKIHFGRSYTGNV